MAAGFADLHNHQFAQLAHGGRTVWGAACGDPSEALRSCCPAHGPHGICDFVGNIVSRVQGGKGSLFGHGVGGYPDFKGWPRWGSMTHQAVHEDWLHRAVQGGLRLMVMLAVNNKLLCKIRRAPGRGCGDMEAVDLQLRAAREMEAHIDAKHGGPGQGWYRIVTTPTEARAVINADKLAVVLGIEVDHLFGCHTEADLTEDRLRQELDSYHALGVRHIFPIHFGNNGFGGGAFEHGLIWDVGGGLLSRRNPLGTLRAYRIHTCDGRDLGYEYRTGRRNVQGLTGLGTILIRELITRGMIIDLDHMSAASKADTFDLCEAADYPVVTGHSGFLEISRGEHRHERQLHPDEIERIRRLGGMVSFIAGQGTLDQIDTWRGHPRTTIEHTCGGTANSTVQAYLYAATAMGCAPVGLGTDLNGFAVLPGPRFGPHAAPGGHHGPAPDNPVRYPFNTATGTRLDTTVTGRRSFDINTDGVAHVGLLPDLLADFQAMGLNPADLDPLLRSADGYLAVWEKASKRAAGPQAQHQLPPSPA